MITCQRLTDIIARLRKMRGPGDGKGAFLGDGIHDGEPIRAIEIADTLEASTAESQWNRFIACLNTNHTLRGDLPHKNFIGSIEHYRQIFMEANTTK